MYKFGLLGNNIKYSYSKLIHEYVFKYYNLDYTYEIYDVDSLNLDNFMFNFKKGMLKGINVTIPYKEKVLEYIDILDDSAIKVGNVNTIINDNGKLIGYNTDYYGFDSLLKYYNIVPNHNDNIYILGTGGAAKTVSNVIASYSDNVYFVSRNNCGENIINYNDLLDKTTDYIINCTPCGDMNHLGEVLVNSSVIKKTRIVIDLIYNPKQTKLLELANSQYNGLVMLIYQALEADKLFTNINIDTNCLIKKVGELFE